MRGALAAAALAVGACSGTAKYIVRDDHLTQARGMKQAGTRDVSLAAVHADGYGTYIRLDEILHEEPVNPSTNRRWVLVHDTREDIGFAGRLMFVGGGVVGYFGLLAATAALAEDGGGAKAALLLGIPGVVCLTGLALILLAEDAVGPEVVAPTPPLPLRADPR
jgi:hypothetical protein